ncbi:hypothetical protein [Halosimplex sp. J119]
MTAIAEYFDVSGTPRRAAYLFFQLVALYLVAVFSLTWGALGLPIVVLALFLAVYVTLKQVEGIVEDKLTGNHAPRPSDSSGSVGNDEA